MLGSSLLIFAILLWSCVHFTRSLATGFRQRMINRIGLGLYKGLFSLLIIISVVLMVFGWRYSDDISVLYTMPTAIRHLTGLLMLVAFVLFFAARPPTNIKRWIRHPQLTGVIVWAIAHLLVNGDLRSLLLFGGIGLWAIVQILIINHRLGAWKKPPPKPITGDIIVAVISLAVYALFVLYLHQAWFGIRPF